MMSAYAYDPRGLGSAEVPALAFLELSSISRGLFVTDVALKKASVRVLASHPISGGKHVLLFCGDVASVTESYAAAVAAADGTLLREILIAGVHPRLAPFLDSLFAGGDAHAQGLSSLECVGLVESATLAGAILAADRALKAAHVALKRMRLGQGIGGKAYFVLGGEQDEVEAALEAASAVLKALESAGRVDIIPNPTAEALAFL